MSSSRIPGPARRASAPVRRGFTLLESLVALVVIGLAAAVAMEALAGALRGEGQVGRHLEAVALAEAAMDELALVPRDSLRSWAESRTLSHPRPFDRYRARARLREVPGSASLVEAGVTVEWRGGEYSLATVFYRPRRGLDPSAPPAAGRP